MAAHFFGFLEFFNWVVLAYFLVLNLSYFAMTLLALWKIRDYSRLRENLVIEEAAGSVVWPPVTLIAPAHNEEKSCIDSTQSLLTLVYPEFDVLFVNDGSSDGTVQAMARHFDMEEAVRVPTSSLTTSAVRKVYRSRRHPNLWMIDKENGGKADALNCGINHCRTPLFCALDADSILEREALKKIVHPFLEDTTTVAVGGIIRIANGCRIESGMVTDVRLPSSWIAKFQVLEYLRAFLAGRMGWSCLDSTLIVSGAFGIFQRSAVAAAGGFRRDTVGEDMEMIVRLHRFCRGRGIPYRVIFVPDPVAWTECPETLGVLGRQRDRWQRGLIESLLAHAAMLFNPKYGRIGLFAFPYFFFLEMLGPGLELAGYASFAVCLWAGRIDGLFMAAFFMVAFVLGVALSLAAVSLEELSFRRYPRFADILRLFALAVAENFGYRQLVIYWRVKGIFSFLAGSKSWGRMERRGFAKPIAAAWAMLFLLCSVSAAALTDAERALREKDFGRAEQIYRTELAANPASREALFGLARALAYAGKIEESLELHGRLLAKNPKDADALLSRGRVRAWSGDFKAAEEDLLAVTADKPDYVDAWSALGDLYLWSGRPEQALRAYEKQSALAPDDPAAWMARAKAQVALRRFHEARALLREASARGAERATADALLRELDRIPSPTAWQASFLAERQSFSSDKDDWMELRGAIKREFSRGSLAAEGIRARRFGDWESAAAADGYLDLWKRAYANLRYQGSANGGFFPRDEGFAELFQGAGPGWEFSASYRHSIYASDRATQFAAGLGRYWGRWYMRAKAALVPDAAGSAVSGQALARFYFGTVDDFAEISGGSGKEVRPAAAGPQDRRSSFGALRLQFFFTRHFGASLSGAYAEVEGDAVQSGLSTQFLTRW